MTESFIQGIDNDNSAIITREDDEQLAQQILDCTIEKN